MQWFVFILAGKFRYVPDHWVSKIFTDMTDLRIFIGFISNFLKCTYLAKISNILATARSFYYVGPMWFSVEYLYGPDPLHNPPTGVGELTWPRGRDYTYIHILYIIHILLSVSSKYELFLIFFSDKITKECIYQINGHTQCAWDFINLH